MIMLNLNDIISNHKYEECILFLCERNVFYFFWKRVRFLNLLNDFHAVSLWIFKIQHL